MNVTEKAAYLKGLAEGLAIDSSTPEGKLLLTMVDVMGEMADTIAETILESLRILRQKSIANLLEARYNKFRKIGEFEEMTNSPESQRL